MITAVYFAKLEDHFENRLTWLRIPQVLRRFREAQLLVESTSVDLLSYFSSEDAYYAQNRELRLLLSAIVQLGLYDRFLKSSFYPQFLIGCHKGDSALKVAAGQITFAELVCESPSQKPKEEPEDPAGLPILAGAALTEYNVYSSHVLPSGDLRFQPYSLSSRHLREIARTLVQEQKVSRWVNIGTHCKQFQHLWQAEFASQLRLVNSVDLDPALSWMHKPLANLQVLAR